MWAHRGPGPAGACGDLGAHIKAAGGSMKISSTFLFEGGLGLGEGRALGNMWVWCVGGSSLRNFACAWNLSGRRDKSPG